MAGYKGEIKSFKDINGNKVVENDLISLHNYDDVTSIFQVIGMRRSQRRIEVTIKNQKYGVHYVDATDIISEM